MSQRSPASAAASPMMAQHPRIKEANPGGLLFYRMGDFYELFVDAAVAAAAAVGTSVLFECEQVLSRT